MGAGETRQLTVRAMVLGAANAYLTAASAGKAVAAGAIFTLRALVLLGYWHGFP